MPTCVLYGPFREAAGTRTVTVSADTVDTALAALEEAVPDLEGRLVADGDLAGSTVVTVDRTDIRHLDGLETRLEPADTLRVVPSVYGG